MSKSEIKLTAIAVDDEKHCLDTLRYELQRHCPYVSLEATYEDPAEAFRILQNTEVDIVFMDIHLKSTSGIELVERLLPYNYQVIFTTAYDEYALQAFDVAASHYLLKPINGIKLKSAIDRVIKQKENKEELKIRDFAQALKLELIASDKVPFPVQSGIEFINPHDILYVQGDNNYSIIYLQNGEKLVISKTLSNTENQLHAYNFLRIHKSYLINLNYLKSYSKSDGGHVVMKDGKQLSVSRAKKVIINQLFK